jgi:cytochrome P450 family 110
MRPKLGWATERALLYDLPGPRAPAAVQAVRLSHDPYGFLSDCARRYGDVFTMRSPGDAVRVVLADPTDVAAVLALHPDRCAPGDDLGPVDVGTDRPDGLPVSAVEAEAEGTLLAAHTLIDRWRPGQRLVLIEQARAIARAAAARAVLGPMPPGLARQVDEQLRRWLSAAMEPATRGLAAAIGPSRHRELQAWLSARYTRRAAELTRWPLSPWQRAALYRAALVRTVRERIERWHRSGDPAGRSWLQVASGADGADGHRGADDRDRLALGLVRVMAISHQRLAASLCWAVLDLCCRPPVLQRVRDEIDDCFGDGPTHVAGCAELMYLNAVACESLRLTPVVPWFERQLLAPFRIRHWTLPAATQLVCCRYLAHRHGAHWTDAEAFRPERFLPSPALARGFYPCAGGVAETVGEQSSWLALRVALAVLLRRVRFRIPPESNTAPCDRGMGIEPRDGLVLTAECVRPHRERRAAFSAAAVQSAQVIYPASFHPSSRA